MGILSTHRLRYVGTMPAERVSGTECSIPLPRFWCFAPVSQSAMSTLNESSGASASAAPFSQCAELVKRLHASVRELERQSAVLQIPPLAGREWFELLDRKLVPQLVGEPFIVAAVVGGTNIGKSVVFNHLAGVRASATSPLASGTKHPVCLVPTGFADRHDLPAIFPGFDLIPWSEAVAALGECDEHRLFWKPAPELPANLLILDTPDIDSDAPVNWLRADRVRHCADVLVAVLTQQKYNDAAVKQFFRKAAAEDKAVVLVFNQCLLPEDEAYWPRWLETFSRETGIRPDVVYLAPNDRRAAEENRLPFYERPWPIPEGFVAPQNSPVRQLRADLSEMKFTEIKLRTLRGSLRHVTSVDQGLPAYLAEVKAKAAGFQDAAGLLSMHQLAKVENWPAPASNLLVAEIQRWWRLQRQGVVKQIHDVYGTVGRGLMWPVRWATQRLVGETPDPAATYATAERDMMLQTIDTLYAELTRLSQLGNELLRPRLESLLAGQSRVTLLQRLTEEHAQLDVVTELREVVDQQMQAFRTDSPGTFDMLRKLDTAAAVARPVTSVVLFAAAAGPAGHALTPFVSAAAAKTLMVHVLGDVAGGTGAMVVGETALTGTATGLRLLEARFRQLQTAFTAKRVAWFSEFLRRNILGRLHDELDAAVKVATSPAYKEAARICEQLVRSSNNSA